MKKQGVRSSKLDEKKVCNDEFSLNSEELGPWSSSSTHKFQALQNKSKVEKQSTRTRFIRTPASGHQKNLRRIQLLKKHYQDAIHPDLSKLCKSITLVQTDSRKLTSRTSSALGSIVDRVKFTYKHDHTFRSLSPSVSSNHPIRHSLFLQAGNPESLRDKLSSHQDLTPIKQRPSFGYQGLLVRKAANNKFSNKFKALYTLVVEQQNIKRQPQGVHRPRFTLRHNFRKI